MADDWVKRPVVCSECKVGLMRRLYRPRDNAKILNFFCDRKCKAAWQRRAKPVDESWLRQKYIVEGLTAPEIGRIVGRDSKGVWNWLRGYGIETRPRGSHKAVQFKPGVATFAGKRHSDETKERMRARRLADGHFPKQLDGSAWWTGKTGTQHPKWAGGTTPERQAFYASPEWLSARQATYIRANGRCERCQCMRSELSLHIHHVWPFVFKHLRASLRNLRVLCGHCHRWVHSKSNGDREFLPPFGVFPIEIDGITLPIPISYRPTVKARLPTWLT